jgi:hypothetical protein
MHAAAIASQLIGLRARFVARRCLSLILSALVIKAFIGRPAFRGCGGSSFRIIAITRFFSASGQWRSCAAQRARTNSMIGVMFDRMNSLSSAVRAGERR